MIALALFLRRWWPYLLAGLVLAGFVTAGAAWVHRDRAQHVRDGALSVLVPKAQIESVAVVRWDTIVVHDTVRLNRLLTHYDTATRVLNIHDTVQVLAFQKTADSTVGACRQSVLDLLSSCQAKDTLIATQRRIIDTYRVAPGTPADAPVKHWHLGATAGYGATWARDSTKAWRAATGPTVAIGGTWTPF